MKEQVQELGVRRWFGDDFTNMQEELYAALRSIISDYGSCILSGCEVTDNGDSTYDVSAGIAFLLDSTGANGKFCRVYAQDNVPAVSFPLYVVQASRDRTAVPAYGREYKDAATKNIIIEYFGDIVSVLPAHSNYVTVASTGATTRLRDILQDGTHRFVTDANIAQWNSLIAEVLIAQTTLESASAAITLSSLNLTAGNIYRIFCKIDPATTDAGVFGFEINGVTGDNYNVALLSNGAANYQENRTALYYPLSEIDSSYIEGYLLVTTGGIVIISGTIFIGKRNAATVISHPVSFTSATVTASTPVISIALKGTVNMAAGSSVKITKL